MLVILVAVPTLVSNDEILNISLFPITKKEDFYDVWRNKQRGSRTAKKGNSPPKAIKFVTLSHIYIMSRNWSNRSFKFFTNFIHTARAISTSVICWISGLFLLVDSVPYWQIGSFLMFCSDLLSNVWTFVLCDSCRKIIRVFEGSVYIHLF